jgi:hypothetical protein
MVFVYSNISTKPLPIFFALFSLVDTLPPHLQDSNLEPSPDLDELPEDITLAQTASTWKYIVQFQAQQKQH